MYILHLTYPRHLIIRFLTQIIFGRQVFCSCWNIWVMKEVSFNLNNIYHVPTGFKRRHWALWEGLKDHSGLSLRCGHPSSKDWVKSWRRWCQKKGIDHYGVQRRQKTYLAGTSGKATWKKQHLQWASRKWWYFDKWTRKARKIGSGENKVSICKGRGTPAFAGNTEEPSPEDG